MTTTTTLPACRVLRCLTTAAWRLVVTDEGDSGAGCKSLAPCGSSARICETRQTVTSGTYCSAVLAAAQVEGGRR